MVRTPPEAPSVAVLDFLRLRDESQQSLSGIQHTLRRYQSADLCAVPFKTRASTDALRQNKSIAAFSCAAAFLIVVLFIVSALVS